MVTLSEFFESHYRPIRLSFAEPSTVLWYEYILSVWRQETGDPPLAEVTDAVLAGFVGRIAKTRCRATAQSYRGGLLCILNLAGPRSRDCRDGCGILEQLPWCRPVPQQRVTPRTVSDGDMPKLIRSCRYAILPLALGSSIWWGRLIAVLLYTGARISAALRIEDADIDWTERELTLRAGEAKTRIEQVIPLHERAFEALAAARGQERLLEWPHHLRTLQDHFRRQQKLAGIAKPYCFKHLRNTAGTTIAEAASPLAAQLLLGHTTFRTTTHYLDQKRLLRKAVDAIE